ncbi:MAG: nucleoside-diphosphate sugar epimerase/dehydratase [Methylophilaceae bacterium]|nr:nucleoside-diphosphate sugar epimerase/dehydratase [Methylophilaceae bacterium]
MFFTAPVIGTVIFIFYGLYRSVTRFVSFDALWIIIQAVSMYSLIWGAVFLGGHGIPRSVVLINWILMLCTVGAIRLGARWLLTIRKKNTKKRKRALIYGAGSAGVQLAGALNYSNEYKVFGFLDEAKGLQGANILGLNVFPTIDIGDLINKLKIDDVLIALPSSSRSKRFEIIASLEAFSVHVRVLPSVSDLAGGRVTADDLQEVSIEDLLGRDAVSPNQQLLSKAITGKSVVVTGAGGSIGSEICRQIINLKPKRLVLYEMSELALFSIEKELSNLNVLKTDIYPLLGSVNNQVRLNNVFNHFKVDTVYHAAAYKHVPMVEFNNTEGVNNNIFGTLSCAQAAINSGVETFVLISTDKAVHPTNTMGATKRCAELILQALSMTQRGTKFTMVRFGNVLNSSGSVIPLFKSQIKNGGPVTVTDKSITRYFMMISEAVELVIQAGAMGEGGDVFVLDMGKPVEINLLAKKMIKLSGLNIKDESNPDGDIEIKYTGLRPGEKLFEELLIGENTIDTDNPLIMRAKEDMLPWDKLKPILENIKEEIESGNNERIRKFLIQLVPTFKPQSKIMDVLSKKV